MSRKALFVGGLVLVVGLLAGWLGAFYALGALASTPPPVPVQANATLTADSKATPPQFKRDPEYAVGAGPSAALVESDLSVTVKSYTGYYPASDLFFAFGGVPGFDGAAVDPRLYLYSPRGQPLRTWELTNKKGGSIGDRRVLKDGRIAFILGLEGAYIMTYDGTIDWYAPAVQATHDIEQLPNGNIMTVGSLCDCVREWDYATRQVVWQWSARQTFYDYNDSDEHFLGGPKFGLRSAYANYNVGSAAFPGDWSHINNAQYLPETDSFLLSLRNFDLVVEVNRAGEVVWSWGPGIIKQQHAPVRLADGSILVLDNGNHRAVRIAMDGEVLWQYDDLYVPIQGEATLLSDGNYKVVDSMRGIVKVVSPAGDLLWSLTIDNLPMGGLYRAQLPGLED